MHESSLSNGNIFSRQLLWNVYVSLLLWSFNAINRETIYRWEIPLDWSSIHCQFTFHWASNLEKTLSTFPSLSYRCTLVTLRRAVFLTSVHLSSVGDTFHIAREKNRPSIPDSFGTLVFPVKKHSSFHWRCRGRLEMLSVARRNGWKDPEHLSFSLLQVHACNA
jgi:hypothetical protein